MTDEQRNDIVNLSLRGLIPRMGRLVNAVLDNAGQISAEFARQFAESEFEKYRVIQDKLFESDFDSFSNPLLEFPDDFQ